MNTTDAMKCRTCGLEVEVHESGLCDSCETQDAYDRASAPSSIGIPYAFVEITDAGQVRTCPVCGEKCTDPLESFDRFGEMVAPSAYQNHYAEMHAATETRPPDMTATYLGTHTWTHAELDES